MSVRLKPIEIQTPSPSETDPWYAVQTQPRKEAWAIANLANQGLATFYPRLRKTRRHARRIDTVLAPMFPGYLFVQLPPDRRRWRSVNGTRGVIRLVSFADSPQPVPAGIIATMRASVDENDVYTFNHASQFRVGDDVRMMVGPFAEQLGRIDRLDSNGRVQVLLELMGRLVRVAAQEKDLAPERKAS